MANFLSSHIDIWCRGSLCCGSVQQDTEDGLDGNSILSSYW